MDHVPHSAAMISHDQPFQFNVTNLLIATFPYREYPLTFSPVSATVAALAPQ
jgi:hypothetical protein